MARAILALCVATLICVISSGDARAGSVTIQEVTITGAGGVQLACSFVLPSGPTPTGGWPGIVVFPSLGVTHDAYAYDGAQTVFAFDGFASVSCDERGTGASTGSFDLAGARDAQDAQAIFNWLTAQPGVSPTRIGAIGVDLGGAEVWDAAVAGVPFKAIVAGDTWSSLDRALKPTGVLNAGLFQLLSTGGPTTWNTTPGIAARSYRKHLHSLAIPTLIVQARRDFRWDLSQATAAYGLLSGPKRLSVVWSPPYDDPEIEAWFKHYLARGPKIAGGVDIESERPGHTITTFRRVPPTRPVSVNLLGPGLKRSVRLPGGPLETFGGGSVTVRYADASWAQAVATVSTAKGKVVTEGAAPVAHQAGVLKIQLLNEAALLRRGKKIVVTLSSHDATFGGTAAGTIAIQRVTLRLSVLARAVSH
ncbi:MAG TPA: CocE/NonD family hydrolase [Gaiellaceae bacterium]|nr:CocE/NonD family hydrolase [Gaiellaceae bacterium]